MFIEWFNQTLLFVKRNTAALLKMFAERDDSTAEKVNTEHGYFCRKTYVYRLFG